MSTQEFEELMNSETRKVKVKKRKGYFVRYLNVYGRRHQINRSLSDGITRNFVDGKWIEVPERDARKFRADAEVNRTWEYKEEMVIVEASHHYARFMGFQGKKVARLPLYDLDTYGDKIPHTDRIYTFPRGVWVILHENDVAIMQQKANANAHWEFDTIQLPSVIEPPIKITGQSPSQYARNIYDGMDKTNEGIVKEVQAEKEPTLDEIDDEVEPLEEFEEDDEVEPLEEFEEDDEVEPLEEFEEEVDE